MEAVPPPDQGAPPPPPQNQVAGQDQGGEDQGASFQNFYDQLSDQGQWVQTDNYGYAFQPTVTDPNWAPYTDGHWVYTDDGWTWVSDEPWGWATYHYGRWVNIVNTGWCWIPGYRWAPAWVSWRYGGGYCGWAPLPPETFVGAEYAQPGVYVGAGFHFGGDVDVSFNIGPGCYNFVPVGCMGARNYRGYYIDRSHNYVVINNTTNITNLNIGGPGRARNFRGINAGGPPLAQINAHAQNRVQTVRLTEATRPGRAHLSGDSLAVYAPRVNGASVHQARPARIAQTIDHPAFNRGDSVSQPLAVNSHLGARQPSTEAVQAAETAQHHRPANARVATENTAVSTPMTQPLTSLQPVSETHSSRHNQDAETSANGFHHTANVNAAPQPAPTPTHVYTPSHEDRATANSATGEPVHHAQAPTYYPQTQGTPTQTYHPQTQPAPTQIYHPPTQAAPAESHHHDFAPGGNSHTSGSQFAPAETHSNAPVYHQESAPAFHQQQAPPAQSFHHGGGSGGGGYHPPAAPPQPQSAPAPQATPTAQPQAPAPQAQGSGGQHHGGQNSH